MVTTRWRLGFDLHRTTREILSRSNIVKNRRFRRLQNCRVLGELVDADVPVGKPGDDLKLTARRFVRSSSSLETDACFTWSLAASSSCVSRRAARNSLSGTSAMSLFVLTAARSRDSGDILSFSTLNGLAPRNRRCALVHVVANHGLRSTSALYLLANSDPDPFRRVPRLFAAPSGLRPGFDCGSARQDRGRTRTRTGRSGPAEPVS